MGPMPTRRGARKQTNAKRITAFGLTVAEISMKRCGGAIWVEMHFPEQKTYFGFAQGKNTPLIRGSVFWAEENGNTLSFYRKRITPGAPPLNCHAGSGCQWHTSLPRGPQASGLLLC